MFLLRHNNILYVINIFMIFDVIFKINFTCVTVVLYLCNGLFTLPDPDLDSDSDSDSKPYGYIVLFRTFHIGSDPDPDPFPLVFV